MNQSTCKPYTEAELARQALEMLAIGNVAVRRAQERNRALGIANYYSIGGRIVSDKPTIPVNGNEFEDLRT